MYKYIVTVKDRTVVSILIDAQTDRSVEVHVSPLPDGWTEGSFKAGAFIKEPYRTGDIFIGRISHILRDIQAAFVMAGPGSSACYLPLDDLHSPVYTKKGSSEHIQEGDELLLQIRRPAMKAKAASVTTSVSIKGRYVILSAEDNGVNVSKKLGAEERTRLRSFGETWREDNAIPYGVLLRTACSAADEKAIIREWRNLAEKLDTILQRAPYVIAGTVLYEAQPPFLEQILRLDADTTQEIITDDAALAGQIREALKLDAHPLMNSVRFYEDPSFSLWLLYSLEHRLKEATDEKVSLSSGASIIIQHTEAMTVIDVNSSKTVAGRHTSREEALLKTNLLAAAEIAHQIRLRNISGIIIIDFINMEKEESQKRLIYEMKQFLAADPVQTVLVDITKLGLMEITRKKEQPSLLESMGPSFDPGTLSGTP